MYTHDILLDIDPKRESNTLCVHEFAITVHAPSGDFYVIDLFTLNKTRKRSNAVQSN